MLALEKISLTQFRNYQHQDFTFRKKIIGITGRNGTGKTNLLDAIHYLCFTKSYFHAMDQQHIRHNANGFRLEGTFQNGEREMKVSCVLKEGAKKEFRCNGTAYLKFSQHIGLLPAVMIAPDDAEIISGGSDERRRWLDTILCQLDIHYLDHLIAYQKTLQQRNSLLRLLSEKRSRELSLFDALDALDTLLVQHGIPVFESRKQFLENFLPAVKERYHLIADNPEETDIIYQSSLHTDRFNDLLLQNREKDILLQRTTRGIHRDDLLFLLNGHPVKTTGSQGQRKSFLFALKLTQYHIIREHKHLPPLLLLDDIFEKMDNQRIQRLVQMISSKDYGQIFITDTDAVRLKAAFGLLQDELQLIEMQ